MESRGLCGLLDGNLGEDCQVSQDNKTSIRVMRIIAPTDGINPQNSLDLSASSIVIGVRVVSQCDRAFLHCDHLYSIVPPPNWN